MDAFDVAVVGAGFGGLGAALSLAERGKSVVLLEALTYPGGCAATFHKKGIAYEAGATLFSGLGPKQAFTRWIDRHSLDIQVQWPDPVVTIRTPGHEVHVHADRARFIDDLCARPGAPVAALRRFFAIQQRVAEPLWALFDAPEHLPPLCLAAVAHHARRLTAYAPALRFVGRPLTSVFAAAGLSAWEPFDAWATALCQITVQCAPDVAEAPFALTSLDYPWRGTGHIRGGIGALAKALASTVATLGGEVRYASRVAGLERQGADWVVVGPRGSVRARAVVANVLPADLAKLLTRSVDDLGLSRLDTAVRSGWGAVMLYLVVRPPEGASPNALHFDLVVDPSKPYTDGNHAFVSVAPWSPDVPEGRRTATISTHIDATALAALAPEARADRVAAVQERLRNTVQQLLPEWSVGIDHAMTASPRTFERFTKRSGGYVGGVPRRTGLRQYLDAWPHEPVPGVWLVGDTVFPGQSTVATAVGGLRVAEAIVRRGAGGP